MVLWQWIAGFSLGLFAAMLAIQYTHHQIQGTSNRRNNSRKDYVQQPNDKCTICLETMSIHDIQYLLCGHALHEECLKNLKRQGINACPVCRQSLS